jgi:hypothetical protein
VYAQGPTPDEFTTIFRNCCREQGVPYDATSVEHLFSAWYDARGMAPRGCHPRDLIRHALALAEYLDQPRALTPALLDAACAGYFVHEERSVGRSA